jgi:hypothetical protein
MQFLPIVALLVSGAATFSSYPLAHRRLLSDGVDSATSHDGLAPPAAANMDTIDDAAAQSDEETKEEPAHRAEEIERAPEAEPAEYDEQDKDGESDEQEREDETEEQEEGEQEEQENLGGSSASGVVLVRGRIRQRVMPYRKASRPGCMGP